MKFFNKLLSLTLFFILISFNIIALALPKDCRDEVPIFSVETDKKEVALTFDLNWAEPEELFKILDVLDKYNVKGTFFVIGKWLEYPPESGNYKKLQEVARRGHEIGNHSYEHPNFLKINRKQIEKEIVMTEKIIYDITGKNSKCFRFPSGAYTKEAVKTINDMGLTSIQWSKDSIDWRNISSDSEYHNVMDGIAEGDIILFHNNGKFTATNLDKIIPELQAKDFKIVTIQEILHKKEFFVSENGRQFKIN